MYGFETECWVFMVGEGERCRWAKGSGLGVKDLQEVND